MNVVCETVVKPQKGSELQTTALLEELGEALSKEPGFIEGYTLDGLDEGGLLARIVVWDSREAAERSADLPRAIALRAHIQRLSHKSDQELVDIVSERAVDAREPVLA